MVKLTLLSAISKNSDRWAVKVAVFRMWNVYQKSAPGLLSCASMLFVDTEGTKIQASIMARDIQGILADSLVEGKHYYVANFQVTDNLGAYKATDHAFKLLLSPCTYVLESQYDIPRDPYCFMPVVEVLKSKETDFADHLIDVIALVKNVGGLEEYRRDEQTRKKLRMNLCDSEGNELELVLFDECSGEAYYNQLKELESPVVVLVNLARIAFDEEGKAQVCSSFAATRVLINPDIPACHHLLESAKKMETPLSGKLGDHIAPPSGRATSVSCLEECNRICISDVPAQEIGSSFVVSVLFTKLETRYGWTYDGCAKCSSKIRDDGSNSICPSCKKKPSLIVPKLKIHYSVEDETGTASVVFWDKQATQILGKTAAEMKQILLSENREYDFPDECDEIIGKRMLLKLKRNSFNSSHSSSSISIQQYTICEDLNNQFDAAAKETDELQKEVDVVDLGRDTCDSSLQQTFDKLSPIVDLTLYDDKPAIATPLIPADGVQDVPLAQITNLPTVASGRAKRKCGSKPEAGSEVYVSSAGKKLLKTIK